MALPQVTADVAHAIQLSLAPVFLLTGIAGMLNVMAGRLGRIIDRGRRLREPPLKDLVAGDPLLELELQSLEYRRRLASTAITACTLSALLVCTVIAALFIEELLDLGRPPVAVSLRCRVSSFHEVTCQLWEARSFPWLVRNP